MRHPVEEIKVSGIVLRTFAYAESDLILRVLTPSRGKVSCIAKSARSSKKRFPHSLDLFDRGEFTLLEGKGELLPVRNFESQQQLRRIRSDLDLIATSSLLCECFELLVNEGTDPAIFQELFELLDLSLTSLDESTECTTALRISYVTISFLAERMGIFSRADTAASGKALAHVLDAIEHFLGKQLSTRNEVASMVDRLRRARAA